MFTHWKIKNIEGYRFAEDGTLWRLGFESNGKHYAPRLIKMQYPNRWIINGKPWSKRQLKPLLVPDDKPVELYSETKLPF